MRAGLLSWNTESDMRAGLPSRRCESGMRTAYPGRIDNRWSKRMSNPWIWAYSDRLSARPGEDVTLHVAATSKSFALEIARVGAERTVVHTADDIAVACHEVGARPDLNGCDWPATTTFTVGQDWSSGYYDIFLRAADGAEARHLLCVKAARPRARMVLVLATNTYQAYNWWGGANTYVWVGGPHPVEIPADEAEHVLAGRLSAERPFPAGMLQPVTAKHRIVNESVRGFEQPAMPGEMLEVYQAGGNGWDCPAGYLDKWEHAFVAWCERNGCELDYLTDYDLEAEERALDGYRCAAFVGHSEYWSRPGREEVERFVDAGGRALILSGNTCYWQCRWEDDGRTFVAYKARAERQDPVFADPDSRHLTSGLWSAPYTGKPEAELTGLSFLFGGYHRFGMCVARGTAGYTVWRDDHWALEGTDLFWGDTFGAECRLVGYENDGAPFTIGEDGLPRAVARLGVPENLEILATAPCTLGEPEASAFSGSVPPEDFELLARVREGYDSPESRRRLFRGHAVMATFTRGAGEVFNSGTTEWAYALAAGDLFVERITRNVLARFLAEG